ncbi:acyl-CoA dehydratase activase [Candidatus Bipolaricaulota sp. J31]
MFVGIDVGSLTVKVVFWREGEVLLSSYRPGRGAPYQVLLEELETAFRQYPVEMVRGVGITGSGGRILARHIPGTYVNELVAQLRAVEHFHPEARTVIEIGGQDSKLLVLDERAGRLELVDFALNTQCAAGTGSFLEQQAARLGLTIEEFSELATRAKNPPYIAGRCAVFAKSDIIHLQQVGTPLPEIIGGLCLALARNFRSDVARGKPFRKPIIFQGGVARNQGMVWAFREVLGLSEDELVIPEHHLFMPAIGAAMVASERGETPFSWGEVRERLLALVEEEKAVSSLPPLKDGTMTRGEPLEVRAREGFLGIDVGSISTKAVVIDPEGKLVAKVYLRTRGNPLAATKEAMGILGKTLGEEFRVLGVGVTGSGRELVGRYVGADLIRNEITSQARAATFLDPEVDTVFEIGGQDSKYIKLEEGIVVDFALNRACAAGTGSFLEEQAVRLGLTLEEMIREALRSRAPVELGERCTVFMESDLIHHQQRGVKKRDLVAGLAYSIVLNYLNRVVGDKPIGERVLFQGGVAGNRAVVAAFENLLERPITVPPHFEVTGAWGVALLAREVMG